MAWKPDYLTLNNLKYHLRIDTADTADDVELAQVITAASAAVNNTCHRQFGRLDADDTWSYAPVYDRMERRWWCYVDDVPTSAGALVAVDGVALAAADWELFPRNAPAKGKVYTRLVLGAGVTPGDTVSVTTRFGWTSVPVPVLYATQMQASRFLARRDSPFGIAGSPDAGSELRLLDRVDPDVAVTLRQFVRKRWASCASTT